MKLQKADEVYRSPLYRVTYFEELNEPIEKQPPIKRSFNEDIVAEYLGMLHEEMYSKDIIITAIYNLEQMIDCKNKMFILF